MVHQLHQLKQAIKCRGMDCSFIRQGENEFHEPVGEVEVLSCRGLFHEANGFLNVSLIESGKVYTKKESKLLVLYHAELQKEDTVLIEGVRYKVIGIDDLGNLHLCLDLSLEVV
ncbi:hypothetical protein LQE92_08850 [Lacrimispora sp. NSJ-141]|uniref:Uncharacterized protein n=1 Tax=Lientehia hominis TaxID=2897778 RepID=A0AAP2RKQ5_9FIRM|nr:hypothetical protein [Lientehia hominis]MCD2492735.1 hypothetical protein [Lientehia hominis]